MHSLCCHLVPIPKAWLILTMKSDCTRAVYVHPPLYLPAILVSLLLSISYARILREKGLDIGHVEEGIALTGNCLDRNIDKMYDIMAKLVHETNFDDVEKLKTLIIGVSRWIYIWDRNEG